MVKRTFQTNSASAIRTKLVGRGGGGCDDALDMPPSRGHMTQTSGHSGPHSTRRAPQWECIQESHTSTQQLLNHTVTIFILTKHTLKKYIYHTYNLL